LVDIGNTYVYRTAFLYENGKPTIGFALRDKSIELLHMYKKRKRQAQEPMKGKKRKGKQKLTTQRRAQELAQELMKGKKK
jgi:hypothetical protein